MQSNNQERKHLLNAKKRLRRIKLFYIHLAGYIILVALLSYNLYILESQYKNTILWLNLSTLVTWTIFISVHAWVVFKGRLLFKKSWEDKKIEEFLKREDIETKMWE